MTKPSTPTDGAVRAARMLGYKPGSGNEQGFAHIIDREAVAPAVRERDAAIRGLWESLAGAVESVAGSDQSKLPIARAILAKYRHLTQQTDTEGS